MKLYTPLVGKVVNLLVCNVSLVYEKVQFLWNNYSDLKEDHPRQESRTSAELTDF